jgi:hypothetical protein
VELDSTKIGLTFLYIFILLDPLQKTARRERWMNAKDMSLQSQ